MAEGTFNLGDYEITDDANGDLVIKDPQGNTVLTWDETNTQWDFNQQALTNLSSLAADAVNGVTVVEPATRSDIQTAINNASAGDRIVAIGDWTADAPLTIAKQISVYMAGNIDVQANVIEFGSGASHAVVAVDGEMAGPGAGSGHVAVTFDGCNNVEFACPYITGVGTAYYFHSSTAGSKTVDNVVYGSHVDAVDRGIDMHGQNDTVEGNRVHNVAFFNVADRTSYGRGPNAVQFNVQRDITYHGSTSGTITNEIEEDTGSGPVRENVYEAAYLSSESNVSINRTADRGSTLFASNANNQLTGLELTGPFEMPVGGLQTANYTTSYVDCIIPVDTSSSAITITLDSTSVAEIGHVKIVSDARNNAATNNITINGEGGESVAGGSSYTISRNSGAVTFYSDGGQWLPFGEF